MKGKWIFITILGLLGVWMASGVVRAQGEGNLESTAKPTLTKAGSAHVPESGTNIHIETTPHTNTYMIVPELIGQAGGSTTAIVLHDNLAYIGIGVHLIIVDVSDPSQPSTIGQTDVLPAAITSVDVVGGFAYLADGDSGLYIIDISNPATPTSAGNYDTPGIAQDVTVAGNYAYVADMNSGMRIIDISNPAIPTETGFYVTYYPARGVTIAGNYAYIARHGGLTIIDISNPAAPTEVGNCDTQGIGFAVTVAGSYAYLASEDGGLRIIDISNPVSPTEAGFYDTPGFALDVMVAGNYAYVADGSGGLRIIDISNPASPSETGSYNTEGDSNNVKVSGNYAYVADGNLGLRIIDISNPTTPSEAGFYMTPGLAVDNTIAGNYAYVADYANGLHIIDTSSPPTPIETGFYDTPGSVWGVTVAGDYAYVADGDWGLRIIDISNPATPIETGFYLTPDSAVDVTIAGNYAYVADLSSGLRIIDVSDPAAPNEAGFFDTSSSAIDVEIAGNFAYVADLYGGLRIIDVSNPAAPNEVGSYSTTGLAYGVTVSGDYAYVAYAYGTDYGGVRIIDVTNPADPTEVGYFDTPGASREVTVAGSYAYIASRDYGLHIIDVSNPAVPAEAGFYDPSGDVLGVTIVGNNAYVAADTDGLIILRLIIDEVTGFIPITGGNLSSTDGNTNFIFPTGAFTQTVDVTYRQLLYDENVGNLVGIGHTFDISAVYSDTGGTAYLAPNQTYTFTLDYSNADIDLLVESTLALYYWNSDTWLKEETSSVDTESNILIATPDHMSLWAIFGQARDIPITTTTSILSDEPEPSLVDQPFTVTFGVTSSLGIPTGAVTVTVSDSVKTCSAALVGSLGACQMALSSPGIYTLIATFAGEEGFLPSSASELHTVTDITTITTTTSILSEDPDPSLVSQPFTVTFGVTSTLGTPTGVVTVTVSDSAATCSGLLVGGLGACQLSSSSPGIYTLTATYAGEGSFLPSSASEQHTVDLRRVHLPLLLQKLFLCSDFFDDFSDPNSGWYTGEDSEGRFEYLNGEYRVLVKPADFYWLLGAPACDQINYSVEVDARWAGNSGTSYGLVFGIQGDFEQFYSFEVNTDYQEYALYRYDSTGWTELVPWTGAAAVINPGAQTNHLKAIRNGNDITLEINGTILGTWSDGAITGDSGTGLIVSSYSDLANADAHFDNFRVTGLGSSLTEGTGSLEGDVQQPVQHVKVYRQGSWR